MAWEKNEHYNEEFKKHFTEEEDKALEAGVENAIVTLIDEKDEEYDYLILQEIENDGKRYLALAACDEKLEAGDVGDLGMDADDIVVVRVVDTPDGRSIMQAINDTDELLAVSRIIDEKFGHLQAKSLDEVEEL